MHRPARAEKLRTMAEAAALVPDGARIALGGFAIYQHPMAFVHELVRQGRRDLTVVGVANGNETDLLAGAGALRRIESSYVGLEKYGLARNFRRKVEAGELEMVDYPELLAWDRFRASQDGLSFWPTAHLGGTDLLNVNPDIKAFACPLTGRRLWALPPAAPDVAVLHVLMADAFGNCTYPARRLIPQSLDIQISRACDRVIITAEKIVSTAEVMRRPHLTEIPAFRVTAVVEAPWGAHPCPVLGFSRADDAHFSEYVSSSHSEAAFRDYLERYVTGVADHAAYLERVGPGRLLRLRTSDPAA